VPVLRCSEAEEARVSLNRKDGVQVVLLMSKETKQRLEDLSTLLGKSAAAFLRECIDQAYESLPAEKKAKLTRLRKMRGSL
jgi:hypothetical protein